MYSSPKFFVPMTIVGAAVGDERAAPAEPPRMIATPNEMANAALAALRVCLRITATPFETGQLSPGPYLTVGPWGLTPSVTQGGPPILPRTAPSRSTRPPVPLSTRSSPG